MERTRTKVRSPRMKVSNVQYAPEGRRGNVYVDDEGRKIYQTSGKSGHSKRYVVMDDGDLKRGERNQRSRVVYQEETEYETVSEPDSDYLVPVRPKGERKSTRRLVEGRPRVVTRKIVSDEPRVIRRTVSEERPVTRRIIREEVQRDPVMIRSRPSSEYIRRNIDDERETYVVRSRPASEIVRSRPRERGVYVMRERPSSERRVEESKEISYIRPRSEERALARQEIIEYPQEYIIRRPPTRDVGCQMTTNYVIQQPPKPRKLLRNVQTQTIKKEKQRKIKTATRYYQRETVEVVHEPSPRLPTPPPPPPPRIPTPEPPRTPTPEPPRQVKKKKKKKEKMQLVVKQPLDPEPVYDTVEDIKVVPDSSKIYYEAPKKSPSYKKSEPEPPRYAYYEPSEYSLPKKNVHNVDEKDLVPLIGGKIPAKVTLKVLDYYKTRDPDKFYIKLDITAEPDTSSSENERMATAEKFYSVPLRGSTVFYGPYTYPVKRKSKQKHKRKQKTSYEEPRYVESPYKRKKRPKSSQRHSTPPLNIENYIRQNPPRPPVQIKDYMVKPRPALKKSSNKPRDQSQDGDYGAKLPRGPSFYLNKSKPPNSNDTVLYVNPATEKVEPLKYTLEGEPYLNGKKKMKDIDDDDPRYVAIPGFDEHKKSHDVYDKKDDEPLIIVDDSKRYSKNEPVITDDLSSTYKGQKERPENDSFVFIDNSTVNSQKSDNTYLEPISVGPEKWAKGKAHMVRVGGGWMKVEHHRNHHTPLKIYEIPRDANDDKFLYIKSRFNTSKKDVPVAYKKYREEIVRG